MRLLTLTSILLSFLLNGFGSWHDVEQSKYVMTIEDQQNCSLFSDLCSHRSLPSQGIPKTIHVIWLGAAPFPSDSVPRMQEIVNRHPGWQFKFWTDCECPVPCEGFEKNPVKNLPLEALKPWYHMTTNFGEKAYLLRYELLHREGGFVVDHDVELLLPLSEIAPFYDFVSILEKPAPSMLSSSVYPALYLIGAHPHHPILTHALSWLDTNAQEMAREYPGSGNFDNIARLLHTAHTALGTAIKHEGMLGPERNIVFPPSTCAHHLQKRSWLDLSKEHDLEALIKTNRQLDYVFLLAGVVMLLALVSILFVLRVLPLPLKALRTSATLLAFLVTCTLSGEEPTFDDLMGKNTKHWHYVEQKTDLALLDACRALFEKNSVYLQKTSGDFKIPRVVHFIWLGPRPFPPHSVENVRSWIAQHPDWKFKFWTDRRRTPPCENMELIEVENFEFSRLGACFQSSQNWGEKSDILRYEILLKEGGIYVDHDANCLHSFENLNGEFDFYCCLEPPHPLVAGRHITSGMGLLGARAHHPVIERVIDIIEDHWARLGQEFPGQDGLSRTQLVMHRTYMPLTYALQNSVGVEGNRDIVLPASYFFAKSGMRALYSKHFFGNTWSDETPIREKSSKSPQKVLSKINKKIQRTSFVLMSAGLFLLSSSYVYLKKRKKPC